MNNLLDQLRDLDLDDDIILELLGTGRSGWHTNSELGRIQYMDSDSEKVIFSIKTRGSSIAEIQLGPACDDELLDGVLFAADELINPQNWHIVLSRIMISDAEVQGYFKYDEKFMICPAIQDINVGSGLDWNSVVQGNYFRNRGYGAYGPPYPLLLEVKIPRRSNHHFQYVLGLKMLDEYQNLISLLVRDLRPLCSRAMHRQWVGIKLPSSPESEYHLLSPGIGTRRF
jgi:hypothetical protein